MNKETIGAKVQTIALSGGTIRLIAQSTGIIGRKVEPRGATIDPIEAPIGLTEASVTTIIPPLVLTEDSITAIAPSIVLIEASITPIETLIVLAVKNVCNARLLLSEKMLCAKLSIYTSSNSFQVLKL